MNIFPLSAGFAIMQAQHHTVDVYFTKQTDNKEKNNEKLKLL